jgi:hypothetical protein
MSLNDIKLTNQQLADLYKDLLVEPLAKDVPQKEHLSYLGGNLGNILIVVNKEAAAFLSDIEFEFLTNILAACKLSIADVAIVNWVNNAALSYEAILAELKTKRVLLFDLDPLAFGLPLYFPHYQIQPFDNRTFLSAPSLHTLASNVGEKKNFWTALKTFFNL